MHNEIQFKFKIQQFQTDAINSICDVFKGQPYVDPLKFVVPKSFDTKNSVKGMEYYDNAFKNCELLLNDFQILDSIKEIQRRNQISESNDLIKSLGKLALDIEMETGTGKTYVYIKTMFELNKKYGWSKFIVVVPSIAIREGIHKSFEYMQDHFFEHYNKKARYFIYNSGKLNDLEHFASDKSIQVMIINIQAFAARGTDSKRIYDKLDSFQSRRPIDVISANNPIIILDEPQKLSGEASQESLKRFNPLFTINYSATHRTTHNLVYVLDALDAYNQKLVKKIAVKGVEVKNLRGTNGYLYLDHIILTKNKPPIAVIEREVKYIASTNREPIRMNVGDDLYFKSNESEQYKNGYVLKEIDSNNNKVTFTNGLELFAGTVIGDITEEQIRRIQIRETIISHFEKEKVLFYKGIKTLSLFFIDEVAKYKGYDENGNEIKGIYAEMFEEQYNKVLADYVSIDTEDAYSNYLKSIDTNKTHNGYFSIDKNKRLSNPSINKKGESIGLSDDISAYELILKNKKRLLSFEEPTRFIFSHSALREGWDNPNVFQICTLKHSDSTMQKHQEVGRGLRLCVNQYGDRMDATVSGIDVHNINRLTVIASESYKDFVGGLQDCMKKDMYDRPMKADIDYFVNKRIIDQKGQKVTISKDLAFEIVFYLKSSNYINNDFSLSNNYYEDIAKGSLMPMSMSINHIETAIKQLLQRIYKKDALDDMIDDDKKPEVLDNGLNENAKKAEFQSLWKKISYKSIYTVNFDNNELIRNSIKVLNEKLSVTDIYYTVQEGEQTPEMNIEVIKLGSVFNSHKTRTELIRGNYENSICYDLIGKIAIETKLTRMTVGKILQGIDSYRFAMYKKNPEDFIRKSSLIINEQKAAVIVEHITYNLLNDQHKLENIFNIDKTKISKDKALEVNKHISDYVMVDSNIEKDFALALDIAEEVCVYAKLPKGFYIPTPIGNYSPDWAIAFVENKVKHIFFIAETKGSMSSTELTEIEKGKTECCKKLFEQCLSKNNVKYDIVSSFDELMKKVM